MTPTATAIASAMARPVRFMGAGPTDFLFGSCLPEAGLASGDQPIDQPAGDAGRREHLALARQMAAGRPDIAAKIEAVAECKREHPTERGIDEDGAPCKAFGERDHEPAPAAWRLRR